MTNFAQALARIEELLKESEGFEYIETKHLLRQHAGSIVQLGKVAGWMREDLDSDDHRDRQRTARLYDKLMKGE